MNKRLESKNNVVSTWLKIPSSLRSTWEEIDKGNLLRMVVVILFFLLMIGLAIYLHSQPPNGSLPPSNTTTIPEPHMTPF